jgi:hypothetical protein
MAGNYPDSENGCYWVYQREKKATVESSRSPQWRWRLEPEGMWK